MHIKEIQDKLKNKGLKVTPQRIIVLEAVMKLKNHPTAENIIEYVRKHHPSIATGTVYNVLDTLVKNDLIFKVHTDSELMRYDATMEKHHHLYCSENDRIGDYTDHELDKLLKDYFEKVKIPNFKIEDVKLQINGKYIT